MPADSSQTYPPNGISIDFRALPWSSRFATDYCHNFSQLRDFYVAAPQQSDSWKTVIDARRANPTESKVGEIVVQQLQDRGAPDAPGRARQARRVGGHQGRDQVLELNFSHHHVINNKQTEPDVF